jgi:hypothetical protein
MKCQAKGEKLIRLEIDGGELGSYVMEKHQVSFGSSKSAQKASSQMTKLKKTSKLQRNPN